MQLFNFFRSGTSHRLRIALDPKPLIARVDAACAEIEAFRKAAPARQLDAG